MVKRQADTIVRDQLREKISKAEKEASNTRKYLEAERRKSKKKEEEAAALEEMVSNRFRLLKYKYDNSELTISVLRERFNDEGSHIGKAAKEYLRPQKNDRVVDQDFVVNMCEHILESGNTNATISKNLRSLRRCVSTNPYLVMVCDDYLKPVRPKRSMFIALTEDELHNMRKVNTLNADEEAARLIFMISCFTGQRYSDVINLQGVWRLYKGNGTYTLTYNAEKTGTQAYVIGIPAFIFKYRQQLAEMDFNTRTANSNQVRFDNLLKTIAKRAGITDIEYGFFKHDEYIDTPRWKEVGMHTARRTFCTRLSANGIHLNEIKKMAGHTDIGITQRYIVGEISKETVDKMAVMNEGF